jgi:TetR/AcrR family transcriptional regulator, transcriptional repressor for nem operon
MPRRGPRLRPRPRAEAKDATRAALIEAGIALFRERGLDAPSLDEICDRAGYTRGAFYVHFRDREDFIVAVMDRVGQRFLDVVMRDGDAPATLEATAARFLGAAASGVYPLMGKSGVRPHQLLDACVREPRIGARYVGLVVEVIGRVEAILRREPSVRGDVDARQTATLVLAMVIGIQTMMELGVPMDLAEVARTALILVGNSKPEIQN